MRMLLAIPVLMMLLIQISAGEDSVTLLVYRNGDALIQELHSLDIPAGRSEYRIDGIQGRIEQNQVRLSADGVDVVEQEILDVNSSSTRFFQEGLSGTRVVVVLKTGEEVIGQLLGNARDLRSSQGPPAFVVTEDGSVRVFPFDSIFELRFPDSGYEMRDCSEIRWMLYSSAAEKRDVMTSYFLRESDISWNAYYVLVLSKDDSSAMLDGWISVRNKGRKTYESVELKLLSKPNDRAGALIKVDGQAYRNPVIEYSSPNIESSFGGSISGVISSRPEPPDNIVVERARELYVYTFPEKTTLEAGGSKDLLLFQESDIVPKLSTEYHRGRDTQYAGIYMRIEDASKQTRLGRDLPAGDVHIYERNTEGVETYLGKTILDHTVRDDVLRVRIGAEPDIRVDFRSIKDTDPKRRKYRRDITYQAHFHNDTDEDAEIVYKETIGSNVSLLQSSESCSMLTDNLAEFTIRVPAGGEMELTYTFRYTRSR